MDAAFEIVDFVASIFIFLAFIPAVWISGRIILRNSITADRSTRLFLWLVLGGFFLTPLVDLISYLRGLIMLVIPSDQNTGEVALFLGTSSLAFYLIILTAIGVITYSSGIYYGRKIIAEQRLPVIKELALSSLEQNFIALGLAGLFSRMIRGIILNFLSIRIPASSGIPPGFYRFFGWLDRRFYYPCHPDYLHGWEIKKPTGVKISSWTVRSTSCKSGMVGFGDVIATLPCGSDSGQFGPQPFK